MRRTSEPPPGSSLSVLGFGLPEPETGRPLDPGLFGPRSAVWKVARERILLAGGPAALLLQIAHPLVAAGVAAHSDFLRDPLRRLRATLDATLRISFGDSDQARRAASAVEATHRRVRGRLGAPVGSFPAGTSYDAQDPHLALWVHATLVWTAAATYDALVGALALPDRDRYYQEAKAFARLFGVSDEALPATFADFQVYFDRMVDGGEITVGEQARLLARHVLRAPLPTLLRPARGAETVVTAGLLPERVRAAFGLRWGDAERAAFRVIASASHLAVGALPSSIRYWPHYRSALLRMRASESAQGQTSVP